MSTYLMLTPFKLFLNPWNAISIHRTNEFTAVNNSVLIVTAFWSRTKFSPWPAALSCLLNWFMSTETCIWTVLKLFFLKSELYSKISITQFIVKIISVTTAFGSETRKYFQENAIWLSFNIIGDKLRQQSWIFGLYVASWNFAPSVGVAMLLFPECFRMFHVPGFIHGKLSRQQSILAQSSPPFWK